ncbi:MAG: hypothetical protein QXQ18_00860 [Candidatus Aenigmatarchaeota archaeon]
MPYIVGISSGLWGIARGQEGEGGLQYIGIARKISGFPLMQGVRFAQVDLESIAEFNEPHLEKKVKEAIEKLGINFGIHSEAKAFGEIELPYLDESIADKYRFSHERHYYILENCIKLGAKYMLVHSSESYSFLLASRQLEPLQLVDFWGRPLTYFLEETKIKKIFAKDELGNDIPLLQWAVRQKNIMEILHLPSLFEAIKDNVNETIRSLEIEIPHMEDELNRLKIELEERKEKLMQIIEKKIQLPEEEKLKLEREMGYFQQSILTTEISLKERRERREIYKRLKEKLEKAEAVKRKELNPAELDEKEKKEYLTLKQIVEERWITRFKEAIESVNLAYGSERIAYYIIAKYMELTNDPLWKNIVDINVKYLVEFEKKRKNKKDYTVEDWKKEHRIERFSIDDEQFQLDFRLWVPAVSAKYIWGHFMQSKCPDDTIHKRYDLKKVLEDAKGKIFFALETPMSSPLIAEWSRLPNPLQMYYLIKEIDPEGKIMGIAIDLEHLLSSNIDPDIVVDLMPEDAGKFVRIIHSGYPSVLMPAHIHIPLGTEAMWYLYKIYFKLQQKGMGKGKEVYIIFERGSPQEVRQSITALKIIVEFLEKNIKPEDILNKPEEFKKFFGIDIGQVASMERQIVVIREHALDPLKGLIIVPEEEHGFLGRAVVEKGKVEEWRKERFR